MRGRGTLRSIASNDAAATAATTDVQLTLFCGSDGVRWRLVRPSHRLSTSSMDGDLGHEAAEASGAPTTCWRGSNVECEPSKAGLRSTYDFAARSMARRLAVAFQLCTGFLNLKSKFETADPKPPVHVTASRPTTPQAEEIPSWP